MINNLKIKKKLTQLGMTALALVNGAVCLGCAQIEIPEELGQSIESTLPLETPDKTDEIVVTPTPTPNSVITQKPTTVPTEEPTPSPTPYDPYTLTDEEAIEMGTYIYDNYIKDYKDIEGTEFNKYPEYCEKEDIINFVCLFNHKYPTVYPDRYSSLKYGELNAVYYFLEGISGINWITSRDKGENNLFPYSILLKEGRPERTVLEELERKYKHLSDDEVSDEEIYEYFGNLFKMAINSDETFKDWDDFDYILFYVEGREQVDFTFWCYDLFNYNDGTIPAKYVFDNNKGTPLYLLNAFSSRDSIDRSRYSGLTTEEIDTYVGCFSEHMVEWMKRNEENNYVKQRIKGSN